MYADLRRVGRYELPGGIGCWFKLARPHHRSYLDPSGNAILTFGKQDGNVHNVARFFNEFDRKSIVGEMWSSENTQVAALTSMLSANSKRYSTLEVKGNLKLHPIALTQPMGSH